MLSFSEAQHYFVMFTAAFPFLCSCSLSPPPPPYLPPLPFPPPPPLPQLGGTIGDIEGMPFVEAFRQFQFRTGLSNFCNIHVSLVPQVKMLLSRFVIRPSQVTIGPSQTV